MYANIIVDISVDKLDRLFQYHIPDDLLSAIAPGVRVKMPFGRSERTGYVMELTDKPEIEAERIKDITSVVKGSVPVEGQLIELAEWMRRRYGATMNQSLKCALPVKKAVKKRTKGDDDVPITVEERKFLLNKEQEEAVEAIWRQTGLSKKKPQLLYGITGSGKTEVYMELISRTIAEGKQAIVLIPEISLTYQTITRFRSRFGDKAGILHSRLSQGERYACYEKAKSGQISIMVGPRSALFAPFPNVGMIILDEEHEMAYKSEVSPKYHAREVAIKRAEMSDAVVVFGSATPSVDSFYRVETGAYDMVRLTHRVGSAVLPSVEIVDLREELKTGNRSMLSIDLQRKIEERLEQKEQVMLFLNKRGYAGFVSCRACGKAIKCPHCDVTLTYHSNGTMVCHYCGYRTAFQKQCPECGSPYIGTFGTGTQKVEAIVKKMFPKARVLRMDADTTSKKTGHETILKAFAEGRADILVGTQMIVKGHDFPNVTLVGILAADLSLHQSDYHAAERTFSLLTQAAGRAGRGKQSGEVVIQTYQPDHYSIQTAARQDYEAFYKSEIAYRKMLGYPPVGHMLAIQILGSDESAADTLSKQVADTIKNHFQESLFLSGPASAAIGKMNDIYRYVIYIRHSERDTLTAIKDCVEEEYRELPPQTQIMFDFNPESSF